MATNTTVRRRRFVTFLSAMLVLAIASVAFAAWVADGSGEGYVASGEVSAVYTETVAASTASLLYPDGDADVRLTIVNDNPFNVEVTAINNTDPAAITSGDTDCDNGGHQVTFADQAGSWVVPAHGSLNVELENAASMGADSDTNCQNKTFAISVDISAESTALPASSDDF